MTRFPVLGCLWVIRETSILMQILYLTPHQRKIVPKNRSYGKARFQCRIINLTPYEGKIVHKSFTNRSSNESQVNDSRYERKKLIFQLKKRIVLTISDVLTNDLGDFFELVRTFFSIIAQKEKKIFFMVRFLG